MHFPLVVCFDFKDIVDKLLKGNSACSAFNPVTFSTFEVKAIRRGYLVESSNYPRIFGLSDKCLKKKFNFVVHKLSFHVQSFLYPISNYFVTVRFGYFNDCM
jgi:hypothetical protein